MVDDRLVDQISRCIDVSASAFHVVDTLVGQLAGSGFLPLREGDVWELTPGGRYYVVRDGSSLVAFILPARMSAAMPLRLVCAHTDSPALKLKPQSLKKKRGHLLFDVAVYGSPILSTWFDRDLSLAGMVTCGDEAGGLHHLLLKVGVPVTRVANLAIHLNRGVNDGLKINTHEELSTVWRRLLPAEEDIKDFMPLFQQWILNALAASGREVAGCHPLHWDLNLYDTQPVARVGSEGEWLAGPRLDNQLSCFAGGLALASHVPQGEAGVAMLACFDHEEVGSLSVAGAAGNFVESVVGRILPNPEERARALSGSWMLSVDNAHGCHPNYPAQQDENHCPMINGGVVLKTNANQRYATGALSGGYLKGLCRRAGLAMQDFVVRADMACGSTVGPALSARLGIKTADIGIATWAMHSIREVAGAADLVDLHTLLARFYGDVA